MKSPQQLRVPKNRQSNIRFAIAATVNRKNRTRHTHFNGVWANKKSLSLVGFSRIYMYKNNNNNSISQCVLRFGTQVFCSFCVENNPCGICAPEKCWRDITEISFYGEPLFGFLLCVDISVKWNICWFKSTNMWWISKMSFSCCVKTIKSVEANFPACALAHTHQGNKFKIPRKKGVKWFQLYHVCCDAMWIWADVWR